MARPELQAKGVETWRTRPSPEAQERATQVAELLNLIGCTGSSTQEVPTETKAGRYDDAQQRHEAKRSAHAPEGRRFAVAVLVCLFVGEVGPAVRALAAQAAGFRQFAPASVNRSGT